MINKRRAFITGIKGKFLTTNERKFLKKYMPWGVILFSRNIYTIKQTQQLGFNSRIMGSNKKTGLSFPNYKKIAESHNIRYLKIYNNKNLKTKIQNILYDNRPVICELIIDHNQEQMPKAINKRMPNGKSVPTKYEDMYPFLSSKELEENML